MKNLPVIPKIRLENNSTLADTMILVIENVVSSQQLSELNECLLTILCNISPYQKTMSTFISLLVIDCFSILPKRYDKCNRVDEAVCAIVNKSQSFL